MDAASARGYINQLIYDVDVVPDLDDPTPVAAVADAVLEGRLFRHSAEVYVEAIDAVLAEGELPQGSSALVDRHDDKSVLRFLRAVRDELSARLNSTTQSAD